MINKNNVKIYIGDINQMEIKRVRRIDDEYVFTMKITTIKEDASFYEDITGKIISFDFNSEIVSKEVARKFLKDCFNRTPEKIDQLKCYYTSYEELKEKETFSEGERKILEKKIEFMKRYTSQ